MLGAHVICRMSRNRWTWGMATVLSWGLGILEPAQAISGIPWSWITDVQTQALSQQCRLTGFLRSTPLPSPDRSWSVYSRLDLVVSARGERQLTSVVFARNDKTGELQVVYDTSAIVLQGEDPLDFAMLLPYGWQEQTVLIREFEGWFQSDLAWDRAVIWSLPSLAIPIPVTQVWDAPINDYTEVLGWDPQDPNRVIFMQGDFGSSPAIISIGADRKVIVRDSVAEEISPDPNPDSDQAINWELGWPTITGPLCP
jgi:hypothetical protein